MSTSYKHMGARHLENIVPVRAVLEGLAARIAYKKLSGVNLGKTGEVVKKMEEAVRNNDLRSYWDQHFLFHEIFINASGQWGRRTIFETNIPFRSTMKQW